MDINDFLGYEFICKLSADFKNEPDYTEDNFSVVIKKDDKEEAGYSAQVSGYHDGEYYTNKWDAEDVCKKMMFNTWVVIKKVRI